MKTPYSNLAPERYWKTGVAEPRLLDLENIYKKKFSLSGQDRITTIGSCFAQHVAAHMKKRKFRILDVEPPPPGNDELARKYGYSIYSARYGNVYTARQLAQLLADSKTLAVRNEDIWQRDGRYFDALRPAIEPNGLKSAEEVRQHRLYHLGRVDTLFSRTDVMVFTLGLTEAWVNRASGTVYPTCPGVIAGAFDPDCHAFVNFDFLQTYNDMVSIIDTLTKRNPSFRMLLTVSPVPLTATAESEHVLTATIYSKSVLRAVCGSLVREFDNVDYFPSFELIATAFTRRSFYEENLRTVTKEGVERVMETFFMQHDFSPSKGKKAKRVLQRPGSKPGAGLKEDVMCEDALLEGFAK